MFDVPTYGDLEQGYSSYSGYSTYSAVRAAYTTEFDTPEVFYLTDAMDLVEPSD